MLNLREEYYDFSENYKLPPEEIEPDDWMQNIDDIEKDIYKSILDYGSGLPISELKPKVVVNDDGWYGFTIKDDVETTTEEEIPGLWVHRASGHPVNSFDPPKGQPLGITAKLDDEGKEYIKNFLDDYVK